MFSFAASMIASVNCSVAVFTSVSNISSQSVFIRRLVSPSASNPSKSQIVLRCSGVCRGVVVWKDAKIGKWSRLEKEDNTPASTIALASLANIRSLRFDDWSVNWSLTGDLMTGPI